VKKIFSVNLEEKTVERTKEIYNRRNPGTKLSPLINSLLDKWCNEQEKK
jgi:hypothetical protein